MSEIKKLELEIIKHKNLYYQGRPEISDFEYDALEEKLRKIDPENEILALVGSEIFRTEKIAHTQKMLSLNKTYSLEDLMKWADSQNVLSTFKIDGSSCSLVYEGEQLVIGKTRGDGKFGENITNKILCIEHVPKILRGYKTQLEIRGEVYCTEENFFLLSQEMEKLGLEKPNSQRNIVAGLLGRKENIELNQFLNFQAFDLISNEIKFATEEEKFHILQKLGFETPEFNLNNKEQDYKLRLQEATEFMSGGNYLIDGLVFSFNDLKLHDELGETAHHPRYKMAFKFQGETKFSKIKSIAWQVSRNGILTPVANITPTELSGAMVSRVTLHNYGMVKQFQLKIDDEIEIVRSGEVIPKFLGVRKSSNFTFEVPKVCPSCGEKIYIEEIRLICRNETCPDKVRDEILNFIQKVGIEDLSSKRLEELIKIGFVSDIASLYSLTKDQLLKMEKVKDKLADKILANIARTKEIDIITFLSSLGISGGAYNKCEKIVSHGYDSIDKVLEMKKEDLISIESFAEKSAQDFLSSLNDKRPLIKKLLKAGIKFKKLDVQTDSPISGKKFCITGTLTMKRSDLQKMIKINGGIALSSVTKDLDFLITNDVESTSSKFKKATDLKIPIINEETFLRMLD